METNQEIQKIRKEKKQLLKRINKQINELITEYKARSLMIILALSLGLMSCNKDNDIIPDIPEQQQELISQSFSLAPVVKEIQTKGFDPATWVYKYSDTKFELKISNSMHTYTKSVSVNELLQGTVSFSMVAGNYNISYTPVHNPKFADVLDIGINMLNVQINGSPIVMTGQLLDALVIIDIPTVTGVYYQDNPVFKYDSRGFWYAYTNTEFSGLYIPEANKDRWLSISPLQTGKIYWVQSALGATVQLNIPAMTVENIVLP